MNINKIKLLLFILTVSIISCENDQLENEQEQDQSKCSFSLFYYINNDKIELDDISTEYLYLGIDSNYTNNDIVSLINSLTIFEEINNDKILIIEGSKYKNIVAKFKEQQSCSEIPGVIETLKENVFISYIHYALNTDNCTDAIGRPIGDCIMSYSSIFYVKVKDAENLSDLYNTIVSTNSELLRQNEFMNQWFSIRATSNSSYDALRMSAHFYETGLFLAAEPDLIFQQK